MRVCSGAACSVAMAHTPPWLLAVNQIQGDEGYELQARAL